MYTVTDLVGKEIRTHDMFRVSSPFPGLELGENEQVVYIPDDSPLLNLLQSAYECTLAINQEGTAIDITVTKTMEQYWQENPPEPPEPTEADYLLDLDFRLSMIELGLN